MLDKHPLGSGAEKPVVDAAGGEIIPGGKMISGGTMLMLLMLLVQVVYAGVNLLYKLAANTGMNSAILVAYRFLFASAVAVPTAIIFETRQSIRSITWNVLFLTFVNSFIGGTLYQNMYIASLEMTSATFASAMVNLVPAFTFVLAVIFRLEKLGFSSVRERVKVVGTLIGIGGAMVLIFYRGQEINILPARIDLLSESSQGMRSDLHHNQVMGAIFAFCCCVSLASWLMIQALLSEIYPYPCTSIALMNLMASGQSLIYAFCQAHHLSQWKLGWNIRLLTIAISGILASGLAMVLVALCVRLKGPLFVSVFSPITCILVAIAGSMVLDEKPHDGSIIGLILIVCGLAAMLWGKGEEAIEMTNPVEKLDHTADIEAAG